MPTDLSATCDFWANSTMADSEIAGKEGNSGVTWSIGLFLGLGRFFEDIADSMQFGKEFLI